MSSETLEARITAWPDQWKAARLNYSSALAHLAELQRQLARLNVAAVALEPPAEVPQAINNDPAVIAADLNLLNLEHEVRLAALQADHVRAIADIAIREEAADNGLKLTESAVEARVKSDKDAMAAQRSLLNLKHQVDLARIERTHLVRRLQEELRNHLVTSYNTRAALTFTDLDGTTYSVHFDDCAEQVRSPRTQLLGPSYHCTIILVEA